MIPTAAPLAFHRVLDRGAPRPAVALHCSLAHGGAWAGLAEHLHGLTLTAPDQPEHGKGNPWDRARPLHDQSLDESLAIIAGAGQGGPVDLLGHSFGATLALRVALERPGLVRSLTLIEPVLFAAARAADAPEWPAFHARHTAFGALIAEGRHEEALRQFHGDWGNGVDLDHLPPHLRRYMKDRIPLIAAQSPTLLMDQARLLRPGGLEGLAVPTLLIDGGASPPIIGAIHRALAARLPGVTRATIPGAGHMVPITHPGEVAALVQPHLDAA